MPAFGNLILKNAAASNVTYYPVKNINGTEGHWVDRTSSVIAGQARASVSISESQTTRRVLCKQTYPVLTTDGTNAHSHTLIATVDIKIPLISSSGERDELLARIRQQVDDAVVTAMAKDGEGLF